MGQRAKGGHAFEPLYHHRMVYINVFYGVKGNFALSGASACMQGRYQALLIKTTYKYEWSGM